MTAEDFREVVPGETQTPGSKAAVGDGNRPAGGAASLAAAPAPAPTATSRKPCALCGKTSRRELLVYSRWTRNYYCIDDRACKKRAKRRAREADALFALGVELAHEQWSRKV